ncbi:DUF2894 domain-containing protein [Paraburkholderia sp. PREW-6R]|uniref:DUF2894 domain-containing protein n=1 Tax=Paraburkholderia sp. PREW-6R TaxID=3141544 RepID=UPI0031F5C21B
MTSGARDRERAAPHADSGQLADAAPGETKNTARATLDAWRESGADRFDAVRFYFMDALERRACAQRGETRRLLDERLSKLIAEYADALRDAGSASPLALTSAQNEAAACVDGPAPAFASAHDTLASLVDRLATGIPPAAAGQPARASYPELDALDYFRDVWAKVRTEKQLRQSLEQVPGNAGPLNSSSLVHRSLSLMRELSPGYLKQFLSYVDSLSWMDQMSGGAAPAKETPRKESLRKETSRKEAVRTASKGGRGKAR